MKLDRVLQSDEKQDVWMPQSRGKEVDIHMSVDSVHARDKMFDRSRSGLLMNMNTALILKATVYSWDNSIWSQVCGYEAGHKWAERLKIKAKNDEFSYIRSFI